MHPASRTVTTPPVVTVKRPRAGFPFQVGGPIEAMGRLRYIDGCTDSLLIPPWRRGEACLNHLHIPPGVEQTMQLKGDQTRKKQGISLKQALEEVGRA